MQGDHVGAVGGGVVRILVRLDEEAGHAHCHRGARQHRHVAAVAARGCALAAGALPEPTWYTVPRRMPDFLSSPDLRSLRADFLTIFRGMPVPSAISMTPWPL